MTTPITNLNTIDLHRATGLLLALAAVGCGEDLTAPPPADVSRLYEGMIATGPATCTPGSAFDVLEAALGDRDFHITLRVEDLGEQVRLTLLEVQGGTFV